MVRISLTNFKELAFFFVLSFTFSFTEIVFEDVLLMHVTYLRKCLFLRLVPDFAMLLIFLFSLLVMEAREPPKLPTALIHNSSTNNSSSQPSSTSPPSSSYSLVSSAISTFVMEATDPLFFFARSAVEPPRVVLAFTVKPSFTF